MTFRSNLSQVFSKIPAKKISLKLQETTPVVEFDFQ